MIINNKREFYIAKARCFENLSKLEAMRGTTGMSINSNGETFHFHGEWSDYILDYLQNEMIDKMDRINDHWEEMKKQINEKI